MLLNLMVNNGGALKLENNSKTFSAPTGFTAIDALGATLENDINMIPYYNRGTTNKFYMKAGHSGTGKTTLAIQSNCSSVDWWNSRYPETEPSDFIFIDSEDNTTINRVQDLSHWSYEYINKHFVLEKMVDLKNIYNYILKIVDMKNKNKEKFYVETNMLDINGKPLKTWATTYVLIDSIAAIKSGTGLDNLDRDRVGDIKEADISQNIDAMREAKANTDFIMKMKPLCNEYGIKLDIINHITEEQKFGMFDIPKRVLTTLKPGEKMRGGYELIYQAFGIDRVTLKERLNERNPLYGEGIDGMINEFMYIKSKNLGEGLPYRMVMDKREGYKPELSDFEYLFTVNYGINGAGVSMSLAILPEVKFSRKTLEEKCRAHPELARALQFTAKTHIIYTLLLDKKEGPSLSGVINLPYEARVALIFNMTNRYPGYGHETISEELALALYNGKKFISDSDVPLNDTYLSEDILAALCEEEHTPAFVPTFGMDSLITPFSNKEDYIIDDEFWIKK
ncbi:MAG TPA: hypothetical protein PK507_01915 [bacterium]|nr:hypothetical protein [bacterium]